MNIQTPVKYLSISCLLALMLHPHHLHAGARDVSNTLTQAAKDNGEHPQMGTKYFLIDDANATPIIKNNTYFQIKVAGSNFYYQSGFFEHIKKYIYTINTSLSRPGESVQGIKAACTVYNASKFNMSGPDFSFLTSELPATYDNIKIVIAAGGIGEDLFNFLKPLLANPNYQAATAAIDLAPGPWSIATTAVKLVADLTATRATAEDPSHVLDFSCDFSIANGTVTSDSNLKPGYFVIVSSIASKTESLNELLNHYQTLKFETDGQVLTFDDGSSAHTRIPVTNVTWFVLKIDSFGPNRPIDSGSILDQKLQAPISAFRTALLSSSSAPDRLAAFKTYKIALDKALYELDADGDYLPSDKDGIRASYFNRLAALAAANGIKDEQVAEARPASVPANFSEIATKYETAVAASKVALPDSLVSLARRMPDHTLTVWNMSAPTKTPSKVTLNDLLNKTDKAKVTTGTYLWVPNGNSGEGISLQVRKTDTNL